MKTIYGVLWALGLATCGDDSGGASRGDSCFPEARKCDGAQVLWCNPTTEVFEVEQLCAVGSDCSQGRCVLGGRDVSDDDTFFGHDVVPDTQADAGFDTRTADSTELDTRVVDVEATDTQPFAADSFADAGITPDTGVAETTAFDTVSGDTQQTQATDSAASSDTLSSDTATLGDATDSSAADTSMPGVLVYQKILNLAFVDDLHKVAWHPNGEYAVILAKGGQVVRYDHATGELTSAGDLGYGVYDLAFASDGTLGIVGESVYESGALWLGGLDDNGTLVFEAPINVGLGTPRALAWEPAADPPRLVVGTEGGSSSINYLYLWTEAGGLRTAKGFDASGGISDVMWGEGGLLGGAAHILTTHGHNGADSKTWVLASDLVLANGFKNGFGNAGDAGWRPGGAYGMVAGWSSNKLYIFTGNDSWEKATLPVPTGASPQSVAWRDDGTRALIVGRVIGSPSYGVVIEQRAETAGYTPNFVNQSIYSYDDGALMASGGHLLDAAWRPSTPCDEGLIVGTDTGTNFSPTLGRVIRFYDSDDPACAP